VERKRNYFVGAGLLLLLLLPRLGAADAPPTAALFNGTAIVAASSGSTLREGASLACRQGEKAGEGAAFFLAWAFPAAGRIDSCSRSHDDSAEGRLTVTSRDGRIRVGPESGRGLNIKDGPGTPAAEQVWGVALLLYKVKDGHGQVSDMQLLAPDRKYDLGGERLAWLGAADEAQALEFIRGLLGQSSDPDLRQDLVFAVYLVRGQAAVSELIALARRDASPEIREQAIFWLGQKASLEAVKALGDVIESPESLEIKKHAVFALSQLPGEKGTPLLLKIARGNPYPRLRKEAIFWLGESGDPRALEFFEEILLK
jgi:hypothetical protein